MKNEWSLAKWTTRQQKKSRIVKHAKKLQREIYKNDESQLQMKIALGIWMKRAILNKNILTRKKYELPAHSKMLLPFPNLGMA